MEPWRSKRAYFAKTLRSMVPTVTAQNALHCNADNIFTSSQTGVCLGGPRAAALHVPISQWMPPSWRCGGCRPRDGPRRAV